MSGNLCGGPSGIALIALLLGTWVAPAEAGEMALGGAWEASRTAAAPMLGDGMPAGLRVAWGQFPALQEAPPVERRLRVLVRDMLRGARRSLRYSVYLVSNSPTWWWRRVKRLFWPVIFAAGALFLDSGLLSAWKNEGARVLATYVPMMLYVYARLFFSRGASVLARLGVVAALVYGVWRHDLITEGSWRSLGISRLDDLVIIVLAVRLFVVSCPQELVEYYAERAIAIRRRAGRAAPTS